MKLRVGGLLAAAFVLGALAISSAFGGRAATPTVKVAGTKVGKVIVDGNGRTLYYCTCDTSVIECTTPNSGCPSLWPPLFVSEGQSTASSGLRQLPSDLVGHDVPGPLVVRFDRCAV